MYRPVTLYSQLLFGGVILFSHFVAFSGDRPSLPSVDCALAFEVGDQSEHIGKFDATIAVKTISTGLEVTQLKK